MKTHTVRMMRSSNCVCNTCINIYAKREQRQLWGWHVCRVRMLVGELTSIRSNHPDVNDGTYLTFPLHKTSEFHPFYTLSLHQIRPMCFLRSRLSPGVFQLFLIPISHVNACWKCVGSRRYSFGRCRIQRCTTSFKITCGWLCNAPWYFVAGKRLLNLAIL